MEDDCIGRRGPYRTAVLQDADDNDAHYVNSLP